MFSRDMGDWILKLTSNDKIKKGCTDLSTERFGWISYAPFLFQNGGSLSLHFLSLKQIDITWGPLALGKEQLENLTVKFAYTMSHGAL